MAGDGSSPEISEWRKALNRTPDLKSAGKALADLVDRPNSLESLLASAFSKIKSGAFSQALSEFKMVIIRFPTSSHAWEGLAVAALGLGDGPSALKACNEAIKYDAANMSARHNKALALRAMAQLPAAVEVLTEILADHPDEHMSRAARGRY